MRAREDRGECGASLGTWPGERGGQSASRLKVTPALWQPAPVSSVQCAARGLEWVTVSQYNLVQIFFWGLLLSALLGKLSPIFFSILGPFDEATSVTVGWMSEQSCTRRKVLYNSHGPMSGRGASLDQTWPITELGAGIGSGPGEAGDTNPRDALRSLEPGLSPLYHSII